MSAWLWGLQSGSWGPRPCRASSRARAEAAEQTPAWPGLGGDEGCGVSDRGSSGSKECFPHLTVSPHLDAFERPLVTQCGARQPQRQP